MHENETNRDVYIIILYALKFDNDSRHHKHEYPRESAALH